MPHIVKRGETLSKIAKARGITLEQLLDANPKFREHPNQIQIGETLVIPGDAAAPITPPEVALPQPPQAPPPAQPIVAKRILGSLSEKFETGGKGPGVVSSGKGDRGGASYGSYQMTSQPKGGRVREFVTQPDFPFRDQFTTLRPGSPEFTVVWKKLANTRREEFQELQHAFIRKTHFDPLVNKIRIENGLDITPRSHALQDVIWSTAVQHGPGTTMVSVALKTLQDASRIGPEFDGKLIRAIYAERSRKNNRGILVHFSGNSPKVQAGVANRYKQEEKDALKMLQEELAETNSTGT